ncbi:MAG: hypothetical protein J7518_07040 [Nocardioidaceae bacterium]|nr:hypothetical protein [Nocardioidaceae bacterium]
MRTKVAWAGVTLLVLLCVVLAGWRLSGGRWVRVETASMGTQAPVGTLLWVKPVAFDSLRPGDLVTFRAHGARYTHLVKTVHADGTLTTQGRISAPDPWRVGRGDVIGKVVLVWPGAGWVVLAAPVLLGGWLLVWLLVRRLRDPDWRMPAAVVGSAAVLALALVAYRPLTRADQLSFVSEHGAARATYVSTGLVPLRLSATGADPVRLRDGEVGSVLARERDGRYAVAVRPDIPFGWWAGLVAVCFLPVIGRLVRTSRIVR